MKKILLLLLLPIITFAQKEVIINIQTDSYPSETKWVLYDSVYQGDTLHHVPYGYYDSSNIMNIDTVYIPDSITNISFVMFDSYGDGITNGEYYVSICGDTIINYPVSTFNSGLIHNRVVPQCMPQPPPVQLVPAKVIINLDQYQSETSWDIKDTNGIIYASGGNYNSQPDYATVVIPVQIPKGDLTFTIYDSYGDGLNGGLWQGQDGSYFVKQCNDTLVYGTDPAFGNDSAHVFVSDSCPPILGCTDNDYVEWNPFADIDDGSCQTLKIFGCIDTSMYNYDSTANTMELIDTCVYTLVLHDLMGNGWVGSHLKLIHPDTLYEFTHTGGFEDIYYVGLTAPDPITFRFHISSQASLTTIECGFTFINPEGDTLISIQPPFIQPLLPYQIITNCGNTCEEKTYGCIDSTAVNYIDSVNTDDGSCYYNPGCMNPLYIEYDSTADYDDGTCQTLIVLGCMDSTSLNYNPSANVEIPGSCITIVYGCTNPLAFNYNPNANVDDSTCVPIIEGCMNPVSLNYDSTANTDDGSCVLPIYGCTDSTAFNYSPSANVDDSSCVDIVYGCMDVTMFNYNPIANIDNGSCEPFVYGCMDSTMFNFNPLANADNNSCTPYIYGCTDPSMLNFNPQANTEDFSCIPYIYGCMDSAAFNYDSTANTDNGSCISVVEGCMDQDAYSYNELANVNIEDSCFYDAGCITGPGVPYWLNDPCYAWVIDVDEYCCENDWDNICQLTYDYCEGTWVGPLPKRIANLLMITDILGRPAKIEKNKMLFFIYDDGTVEKKIVR
jgi:hypothetical protein|tara:strand:- start:20840 stop:23182 length:2343 start_codon:yes stop_codon:yes gene_type:complete